MLRFVLMMGCLLSLGVDTASADEKNGLDRDGFIQRWLLLAPIDLGNEPDFGKVFNTDYIKGESKVRPKQGESLEIGEVGLTWREVRGEEGVVDFHKLLGGEQPNTVAYLAVYIDASDEQNEVYLRIGSDDACRVWLNGKEVVSANTFRALKKDSDEAIVKLLKGKNILLAKVINGGGDFAFCARFTDVDGKPFVNLTASVRE